MAERDPQPGDVVGMPFASGNPLPRTKATVGVEVPEEWLVDLAEGVIAGLYERPEECATEPEIASAIVAAVQQAIRNEEREKVLGEVRKAFRQTAVIKAAEKEAAVRFHKGVC